ncbi:MAG: hypothetical protein LKJ25_10090 [Clostridia bacterium]|jgi:hypothetical protein|nr:hypothetical protein [Clostridia bacterium]
MKTKRGEIFNILFPTLILFGLFIVIEYFIFTPMTKDVIKAFSGKLDGLYSSDTVSELKTTTELVISYVFMAVLLDHIPSVIFTMIIKHCAKAEPRFNKKIYKIMLIVTIISILYVIIAGLYVGMTAYGVFRDAPTLLFH